MRTSPESSYINQIDRRHNQPERIRGKVSAEEITLEFFAQKVPGMEARLSTVAEDHGYEEGGKALDIIVSRAKRPILGIQVTTTIEKDKQENKMQTMIDHPVIRLEEMKLQDPGIPRVLVYFDAREVQSFIKNKDFDHHPQIALKIIGDVLKSLTFHLKRTKNPAEQTSLMELISTFELEQKKYIH